MRIDRQDVEKQGRGLLTVSREPTSPDSNSIFPHRNGNVVCPVIQGERVFHEGGDCRRFAIGVASGRTGIMDWRSPGVRSVIDRRRAGPHLSIVP